MILDELVGQRFRDYDIVRRLGVGGFGSIFLVEHVRHRKPFVLKVLHQSLLHEEGAVQRFCREAELLASLNHPNIVQMFDFDFDEQLGFFLILEWLKGQTLQEQLEEAPFSYELIQGLFEQLCAALSETHQRGILHRDLKPNNIMLLPSGRSFVLKLLDYGIAGLANVAQKEGRLTQMGSVVGSLDYMSPEQLMGNIHSIDARTDIYSVGVLLMECLTGVSPFWQENVALYNSYLSRKEPPTLASLAPNASFSEELEALCAKAIAFAPEERITSIELFQAWLHEILSTEIPGQAPRYVGGETVLDLSELIEQEAKARGEVPPPLGMMAPRQWSPEGSLSDAEPLPTGMPTDAPDDNEWDDLEEATVVHRVAPPRSRLPSIGQLPKGNTEEEPTRRMAGLTPPSFPGKEEANDWFVHTPSAPASLSDIGDLLDNEDDLPTAQEQYALPGAPGPQPSEWFPQEQPTDAQSDSFAQTSSDSQKNTTDHPEKHTEPSPKE